MKNKIRKMLLLICAMMLAFALTACGGSGNDSDTADDTQTEDNSAAGDDTAADDDAAADDTSEDDGAVTGKYASIQEFIESDMMQEQIATLNESLASSGLTIDIQGEGNTLYYIYTIQDEETAAAMDSATLESYLQSQESTLADVADSVKSVVSVDSVTVVVQFLAPDGSELITQEFTF